MLRHTLALAVLVATLAACKKKQEDAAPPPAPGTGTAMAGTGTAAEPVDAIGSGSGAGTGTAADPAAAVDPGELKTPESVLYDAGRDMYMVANINGTPNEADNNGYLTVVNPDGSNERANANWQWIVGGMPDIKLDAPKGMAISGDTLYVADITVVRRFEAKAGKQKPDVAIEGATFLNDVTPDGDGGVFVSDSGVRKDFSPSGTDAIYHVAKDGKVTARIKNKSLGNPNGVWHDGKGTVWVGTMGGELYSIDAKGKQSKPEKLPTGRLDGIVGLEGGDFLISSWDGKCVYRGKPGGEWKPVVSDIQSPADIDYDPKRKRLLIPGFETNKLHIVPL